ncbi:hypothetical protein NSQ62_08100 [Solibacillus sp. FSL H8-0523]|uniref:hypothetical protein n=1 Tax=Solibacillus sp. FSL H8-0523 TaxID=2954511 RepID=UPI0031019113
MEKLSKRSFELDDLQVSLIGESFDFYIDNLFEISSTSKCILEDSKVIKIANMINLKKLLIGEPVEKLYVLNDLNGNSTVCIVTLKQSQNWLIDYWQTHFSDEYREEELQQIYETIENTAFEDLADMYIPHEFDLEEIYFQHK